ncbi:hypothetical protein [Krasilnikovia sp. M28-CT-15]|uniref:hypothetical protein n=1 Tax=Krasilnikovia sp. M28-CT-15 TaxID=3373540 RepID=UPI003876A89F
MRGRKWWGLAGVAAVLAVGTGCTGTTTKTDPPTPPATTTPPAATGTTPTKPAPNGTHKPSPSKTVVTATGGDCPVTGAKLVTALYADPSDIKNRLAKTATLSDVACYQGYAVGLTNPKEADRATVVFRYAGGAWHPIAAGTDRTCDQDVPRTVRTHLPLCH